MEFAKLENDRLIRCPKCGFSEKRLHTNLPKYYESHIEEATSDGWLELIKTSKPEGNFFATYSIKNGKILQEWRMIPDQEPYVDPFDQLRADVDYIAMEIGIDLEV